MCAFGTFEHQHQRVPVDRYAEANPRLDIWHPLQCGALVEGVTTELGFAGAGGSPAGRHGQCSAGGAHRLDR